MTVETLVGYIKEGKKKGFTLEQLHKSLLEQGYNIEEIQNAVLIAENAPTLTGEHGINMEKPLIKKSHNPLIFVVGIVLILILIGALIVLNLNKTGSEETSDEDKTEEELPLAPDIEGFTTETSSDEPEETPEAPDLEIDSQEVNDNETIEEDIGEIPELPEE